MTREDFGMPNGIALATLANGVIFQEVDGVLHLGAGRQVWVYQRGTTTPEPVFQDAALSVSFSSGPVTTDASGAIPGYVHAEHQVDFVDVLTGDRTQGEPVSAADVAAAQTGLSTETTRAEAAETAETSRATAAEAELDTDLGEEATRATAAEGTLTSNLSAEVSRAEAAESANATAITSEATRALAAEAELDTDLGEEATRATAAEATNVSAITAETSRAQAAEALAVTDARSSGPTPVDSTGRSNNQGMVFDTASGKWKPAAIVNSFQGRTGAVALAKADVTGTGLAAADVGADASGAAAAAQAASLQKASNLSDVASAATSRTNLGLGSAATQPSSAFDVAGAASTEQTRAQAAEATKAALTQVPQNVVTKTGAYTAAAGDAVLANATGGAFTVTLPTATSGARVVVKKTDSSANVVTVAGTIDGATNASLSYQNQALELIGDGSGWQRVVRQSLAQGIVDYPATTDARYDAIGAASTEQTRALAAEGLKAAKASNLSDLADTEAAKFNLSVASTSAKTVATANVALSGLQTINGYTLSATGTNGGPDTVLLTAQTTTSQNGLWQCASGAWTRPTRYPFGGTQARSLECTIGGGTFAGTAWVLPVTTSIVIDTSAQPWVQRPITTAQLPTSVESGSSRSVTAATTLASTDSVLFADATGSPNPTNLAAAAVGSGGTFAAGSYGWVVTATGGVTGESIASNQAGATIVLNGSATLTWTAVPGATGYRIYRSNTLGQNGNNFATPTFVAAVGAVTTYTDTGTAVSAGAPPATNGGAFTVTVPDATALAGKVFKIRATGNTANLVTLSPAVGGQTIDGATSYTLGQAAQSSGVSIDSDGSNWRVLETAASPISNVQVFNTYSTSCASGVLTPIAVAPLPVLRPGQAFQLVLSTQITAASGATNLQTSINICDASGNFLANIAFWNEDSFTAGRPHVFVGQWAYDSAYDYDNLVNQTGKYIGAHLAPTAAAATALSTTLQVSVIPCSSIYWPHF